MQPPPEFRGAFRTDFRARAAYAEGAGIYRIVPVAVAVPADHADLALLLRWASAGRIPIVPRGAGSAVTGSSVGPGVVMDLTTMAGPGVEIDPERRRAVTGAAVTAAQLQDAAARHGLRLPPDPSSSRWATLGGMVSTNAAGARSVRYGSVRQWVRRLDVIDGAGEPFTLRREGPDDGPAAARLAALLPDLEAAAPLIRKHYPHTRKNAAGYALDAWLESGDLIDLVIGAEGTLGCVTAIEWTLAPAPAYRAAIRLGLGDLADLAPAVQALLPLEPSALEVLDHSFLEIAGVTAALAAGTRAVLLAEFEADDAAALRGRVGDAVRRTRDQALDVVTALSPEEEHEIWALRHAASPRIASLPDDRRSLQVIEDACIPVEHLGRYITGVRAAAARENVPAVIFGHAGDGNVHVNLIPRVDEPGWPGAVGRIYDEVSALVLSLGGTPSGEHGDGRIRAGLAERQFGPELTGLFRRIRAACDPAGIMNPGVKVDPAIGPLESLKAGPGAAPIPDDIARALREIERGGGYAVNRLSLAGPT